MSTEHATATTEHAELTAARTALAAAQADHAAAVDRRTALQTRLGAAHAATSVATEARRKLVDDASRGLSIPAGSVTRADNALRDAAGSVALLGEALAPLDAAVAVAAEAAGKATAELEYQQFRALLDTRVAAAAALDDAAAALGRAYPAFTDAGHDIQMAWPAKRPMQMHEVDALRNVRVAAWTVPPALQTHIVQTGSVQHVSDLAQRERNTWLNHLTRRSAA